MTSSKTQIQALINKIDEVLSASNTPRSSAGQSEDVPQQQVLEQARNYLASLQGSSALSESASFNPDPSGHLDPSGILDRPQPAIAQQEWWRDRPSTANTISPSAVEMGYGASPAESAQQVLQAIVQEMNYLRVNMMQPLREELMSLYQQRQLLTSDIQRLEQQRHQLLLSQQQINQQQVINDFMQSLMGRLQDQLANQIAQSVESLQFQAVQANQANNLAASAEIPQLNPGESAGPQLTPGQRLQQMQMLQARSDEMLMKLDSTLRVVFESLQGNLESYQDSLGQGLKKMHGMGQQGEAMFAALVNRLAEQLGRGASQYIQSSIRTEWELPGLQSVDSSDPSGVPQQPSQQSGAAAVPDKLPEDQIERLLDSVNPDRKRAESATSDAASDVNAPLIDDLLNDIPEEPRDASPDFNLDDLQLPIDDSLMAAIANAETSEPDPDAESDSDIPADDDMVTLFAIEDEGVVDQVDDYRMDQLSELDADSFLDELNDLTGDTEATEQFPEMDEPATSSRTSPQPDALSSASDSEPGSPSDSESAPFSEPDSPEADIADEAAIAESLWATSSESDEALAFLDQVATEMETDLASGLMADLTADPAAASAADQSSTSSAQADDAVSQQQDASAISDEPQDEIEDLYQMFDSAITPGVSDIPQSFPETESPEAEAPEAAADSFSDPDSSPDIEEAESADADAVEPMLLEDMLFDGADQIDDVDLTESAADEGEANISTSAAADAPSPQTPEPPLSSVDTLELLSEPSESSQFAAAEQPTQDENDLFSELEITTQGNPVDAYDTTPDQVETIHTLDDLMSLDQPRAATPASEDDTADVEQDDSDLGIKSGSGFDRYVMASPDENLLESDTSDAAVGSNLELDATTMQRLASDLSGFEGIDESEVMMSTDLTDPVSEAAAEEAREGSTADALDASEPLPTSEQPSSPQPSEFLFPDLAGDPIAEPPVVDGAEREPETVDSLFGEESTDADTDEPYSTEAMSEDVSGFLTADDAFFAVDSEESLEASQETASADAVDHEESGTSGWRDLDENLGAGDLEAGEAIAGIDALFSFGDESQESAPEALPAADSSPQGQNEESMTVNDLFAGGDSPGLPLESTEGGDRPSEESEEQFDPLDSEDLRQIFEDLKALDDYESEPALGREEQTLVDLLRGVNPPTVPEVPEAPEPGDEPETDSPAETDTSWSIFDDLSESDSSPESEQKKNSEES